MLGGIGLATAVTLAQDLRSDADGDFLGVSLPMSRPTGAWTRSSASCAIPFSCNRAKIRPILRLPPIRPTNGTGNSATPSNARTSVWKSAVITTTAVNSG